MPHVQESTTSLVGVEAINFNGRPHSIFGCQQRGGLEALLSAVNAAILVVNQCQHLQTRPAVPMSTTNVADRFHRYAQTDGTLIPTQQLLRVNNRIDTSTGVDSKVRAETQSRYDDKTPKRSHVSPKTTGFSKKSRTHPRIASKIRENNSFKT